MPFIINSFFIYLRLLFLLRNLLTFSLFCNTSQSGQYFLRVDLCLNSLVHRIQFKLCSAISSLVVTGFMRFQTVSNGFTQFHVVSQGLQWFLAPIFSRSIMVLFEFGASINLFHDFVESTK